MWLNLCLALAASLIAPSVLLAADPASAPASDPLADLVAKIKTEAEAFATAKDAKGPTLSAAMKTVQYNEQNIDALPKALQTRCNSPMAEMYLQYQLLEPLAMASSDLIRKVKQPLLTILARSQYRPVPDVPPAMMKALNAANTAKTEDLNKAMEIVRKAQEEKANLENPVTKQNRTTWALERSAKLLLVLMGDTAADDLVMQKLAGEESAGSVMFQDTLDAIAKGGAQTAQMSQTRAKKYVTALVGLAKKVGTAKKNYIHPCDVNENLYGKTTNKGWQTYFCIPCLNVANVLATVAKMPAIQVPDAKTLEAQPPRR